MLVPLSFISLFSGAVCKLYDDLNDNGYSHTHKDYINEYLKGLLYITITTISLKNPKFYLMTILLLTMNILLDKNAYANPYEFSGALSYFILFLFIDFSKLKYKLFDLLFIFGGLILGYLSDVIFFINTEYSVFKLLFRFFSIIVMILSLCINSFFKIFSNDINIFIFFYLGYFAISCFFQASFILNDTYELFVSTHKTLNENFIAYNNEIILKNKKLKKKQIKQMKEKKKQMNEKKKQMNEKKKQMNEKKNNNKISKLRKMNCEKRVIKIEQE
jgi:hypothetical protein